MQFPERLENTPFKFKLQLELKANILKADEFNGNALSNAVAIFFHIPQAKKQQKCEKIGQPGLK